MPQNSSVPARLALCGLGVSAPDGTEILQGIDLTIGIPPDLFCRRRGMNRWICRIVELLQEISLGDLRDKLFGEI